MRRLLCLIVLLALPGVAGAQDFIRYYPPAGAAGLTSSGTAITSTVPILFPDGSVAAPSIALASDADGTGSGFYRVAANTMSYSFNGAESVRFANYMGTTAQICVQSSNCSGGVQIRNTGITGAQSKTLTDNTATAFVRIAVADDDYEGCEVLYTAFAEDADADARQTRTGTVSVAILNNSGTETAVFSTGDSAVAVTAGTLTCTFDATSAVNNTLDLRATCDTSLDAAAETLTFEYRVHCPSLTTATAQ